MNLLKRLFGKNVPVVQCPRCIGKGHVDMEDIKRFGKELKWVPGECAYCNGRGKVEQSMMNKVSVGETYLTTDLSKQEREVVIKGDPAIRERLAEYDRTINREIEKIIQLYFTNNMNAEQIADYYLEQSPEPDTAVYLKKKSEIMQYIERVIAYSTRKK